MLERDDLPPLQSLVVFEAAARLLSFTAAAKELNMTQPAVSQQIRSIETALGVKLFERIYRGVMLTDEGHSLLKTTQKHLKELRDALQKLQQKNRHPRINVATDFAFAAFRLMPRLPEFRKQYPNIDIRIQASQSEVDLASTQADVAILFGDGQYQGYRSERLLAERVYPVCSPKLLANNPPIDSMQALSSLPLLKLNLEAGQQWMDWARVFRLNDSHATPPEPVMEFDNYTLLVQAVISGQGVGLGWSPLLDDFIKSGVLVALEDFAVTSERGYYTVTSNQQALSDPAIAFLQWIVSTNDKHPITS